jgi:hypothetical protein
LAIREQDKYMVISVEMEFMRTAKYTWKDYKTNDDILTELKINSVVKKIQNYRNAWVDVWRMDRDRLPQLIMKYQPCRKRSQDF